MRLDSTFCTVSIGLACFIGCNAGSGSQSPGGDGDGDGDVVGDGDGDGDIPGDGDGDIVVDGTGGQTMEEKPPAVIEETLPEGFTAATHMSETPFGGWKVLGLLADYDEPASNSCANVLRLIIRDFSHSHIDFGSEKPATWASDGLNGWYKGHVLPDLDPTTQKPVVNPDRMPLDVMEAFEQWYVNIEGVNVPYVMDLWLEPDAAVPGTFRFNSDLFFPLDFVMPPDAVNGHNFGFTTELRTAFEYKGGEVFTFRGDDDVFVFINGKLAVDIGGIHNAETESVNLDEQAGALGIEIGNVYDLLLYQAERNPGASNYRIDTSLDFQSCGILETDIVR